MIRTMSVFLAGMLTLWLAAALSAQPPGRPGESKPILFYIYVPAEAQIEIEGVKTAKTGETRDFKTPDVPIGKKYSYAIKVTYQGKTTTHQMTLSHAGPNILDLRKELTTGKPAAAPPPAAAGPSFSLQPITNISLRPGDAAPLAIKIKRQGLNDPVEVTFQGLPTGVKINDVSIPAGKDEQTALAMTDNAARPGTSVIEVIGKAGKVQKQTSFRLTIQAAGEAKKEDKAPPKDLPADPPPKPSGETKKPGPNEKR